jgi:hypothetical protein
MTAAIGSADAGRHGYQVALARLTDLAGVVCEFRCEVVTPYAPAFVVSALLAPIAWLDRMAGSHGWDDVAPAAPASASRARSTTR